MVDIFNDWNPVLSKDGKLFRSREYMVIFRFVRRIAKKFPDKDIAILSLPNGWFFAKYKDYDKSLNAYGIFDGSIYPYGGVVNEIRILPDEPKE